MKKQSDRLEKKVTYRLRTKGGLGALPLVVMIVIIVLEIRNQNKVKSRSRSNQIDMVSYKILKLTFLRCI